MSSSIEQSKRRKNLPSEHKKRNFSKIPIFIVDYHNEVLEFIYRCLGSGYLPFENNTIIHFDSHPDMVISRDIKASTVYNKDKLLQELSIENWIMPTCYAGHFSKIIWIKNAWCDQIPIGNYDFLIGKNCDDEIQVNLPIDYFLSEGNFCGDQNLIENTKNISLKVINSSKIHENVIKNDDNEYILDIDLDFFSTSNPFLDIYSKANCYDKLKEIFSYEKCDDCNKLCSDRRKQLKLLDEIFQYLELNRSLKNFDIEKSVNIKFENIKSLCRDITNVYDDTEIDWMLVYNAGCTSDNGGLPHHLSNDDELKEYMENFENFLKVLSKPPLAVTISRSSEDDYCPKTQVDCIQQQVFEILKKNFGDKISDKPINWFQEEQWQLKNL